MQSLQVLGTTAGQTLIWKVKKSALIQFWKTPSKTYRLWSACIRSWIPAQFGAELSMASNTFWSKFHTVFTSTWKHCWANLHKRFLFGQFKVDWWLVKVLTAWHRFVFMSQPIFRQAVAWEPMQSLPKRWQSEHLCGTIWGHTLVTAQVLVLLFQPAFVQNLRWLPTQFLPSLMQSRHDWGTTWGQMT